jgi:polar amino acid transport system substrate-binding protein
VSVDHPEAEWARQLAPGGRVRVAINYGNPVLAQRDPATGEPRGVTAAIARELARRTGLEVAFAPFDAAGKVFAALAQGAWDVAFLAIDPNRAREIDFTSPYVLIEGSYMVPAESPLTAIDQVDRAGARIAVAAGSAYDLYLSRTVKQAALVREPTGEAAIERFLRERLDAVGGVKSPLQRYAEGRPGVRVLDGRFMVIEQAVGVPKGRGAARDYLNHLLDDLIASGFVAAALRESGQYDAVVPARPAR